MFKSPKSILIPVFVIIGVQKCMQIRSNTYVLHG